MKRAAPVDAPSLSITRGTGRPLPRQIADQFRDAIACGRLPHGTRLPATRRLAVALGVSRNTVVQAYEELLSHGLIAGLVGDGSYVCAGVARAIFRDRDGTLLLVRVAHRASG